MPPQDVQFDELQVNKLGNLLICSDEWEINISNDMISLHKKFPYDYFHREYFEFSSRDKTYKFINK